MILRVKKCGEMTTAQKVTLAQSVPSSMLCPSIPFKMDTAKTTNFQSYAAVYNPGSGSATGNGGWCGAIYINHADFKYGYEPGAVTKANVLSRTGYIREVTISEILWFIDGIGDTGEPYSRTIVGNSSDPPVVNDSHAYSYPYPIHNGRISLSTFAGNVKSASLSELQEYFAPTHAGSGHYAVYRSNVYMSEDVDDSGNHTLLPNK